MTEDAAPPPPPPLSPPALDTTTIGKYIARFRYEKPQPRESRVSAQRGDFWWTKSPRYVRSPSPPSTWASGGAFSFPDDELDDELDVGSAKNEEEKESSAPEPIEEDDDESVDSVESKLRRRLGVWEKSDSSREISGRKREFSGEKEAEEMQSWGSADWSSVDLQEMDDEMEGQDPEEVIERVRRRLGWGGTSAVNLETAPRLKPLELRLPMDERADRKEASSRTAFKLKPQLSPGSFRREQTSDSGGYRSDSSWGSLDHERGHADERFDEVTSWMSSAGATSVREQVSMMERTCEEKQPAVDESEEKLAAQTTSSADGSDTSSTRGAIDCAIQASRLSVDLNRSQESELSSHSLRGSATAIDDTLAEGGHEEGGCLDSGAYASERNEEVEEEEDTPKEQCEPPENDTVDRVPELPLLQTSSPARPEERASSGSFPRRSHESNSSLRGSEGIVPRETTKTLDSLVSMVVHSWENDFFTDPEPVDVEQGDGQNPNASDDSATNDSTSQKVSIFSVHSNDGNEDKESQAIAPKDICTQPAHDDNEKGDSPLPVVQEASNVAMPVDNVKTQSDHEEEEKEDSPVPGEEEDQIVRMLAKRITLFEEALRQIDS